MEIALDILERRKQLLRSEGLYYKPPKLYLMSADIANFCAHADEMENRLCHMICDKKIKFYPIVCLPRFFMEDGKRSLHYGLLPTLQTPLEQAMFASEDFRDISMVDLEDENESVKAPPTPTVITLGI